MRVGGKERPEDRCSLARLLFGLGQAQLTGVIRVLAPVGDTEEKHELYLRMGRVVHVRPPYLDEPLGHILRDMGLLDHETYARSLMAMAEERARHGTILKPKFPQAARERQRQSQRLANCFGVPCPSCCSH